MADVNSNRVKTVHPLPLPLSLRLNLPALQQEQQEPPQPRAQKHGHNTQHTGPHTDTMSMILNVSFTFLEYTSCDGIGLGCAAGA